MHCAAILSSAVPVAPQHFSTSSHKRHDFRQKKLLNMKCVLWFSPQLLFETLLILRRTQRNTDLNVKTSQIKYPLLSDFKETWKFLDTFPKTQISRFIKIRTAGAELFHVDGRIDMTKVTVAFRNFVNVPKTYKQDAWQTYWLTCFWKLLSWSSNDCVLLLQMRMIFSTLSLPPPPPPGGGGGGLENEQGPKYQSFL